MHKPRGGLGSFSWQVPVVFVDLCRQDDVGFVSGRLWKAKLVLVSLDPVSGAAASREWGQNWHRGWMPLAHPALPVCFVSSKGFCCAVSGLTGEESGCEEGRAGRAGKEMRFCHLMLKTCYSGMTLITAAWRAND